MNFDVPTGTCHCLQSPSQFCPNLIRLYEEILLVALSVDVTFDAALCLIQRRSKPASFLLSRAIPDRNLLLLVDQGVCEGKRRASTATDFLLVLVLFPRIIMDSFFLFRYPAAAAAAPVVIVIIVLLLLPSCCRFPTVVPPSTLLTSLGPLRLFRLAGAAVGDSL